MEVTYRKAKVTEAHSISQLVLGECERVIFPDMAAQGREVLHGIYNPSAILEQIQAGARMVVALHEEELAGAAAMRDGTHIYMMFVAEQFHGHGIGRALCALLLAGAGPGVDVTVNSSLFARRFYRQIGFVETGDPTEKDGVVFVPMMYRKYSMSEAD